MKLFAIGDLHLSHASDKPMDVFGPAWDDHAARVEKAWRDAVAEEDVVLIPGDISWAMQLDEAREDIAFIGALPGTKILMRGNHDYWWASLSKVRAILPKGVHALQNDAIDIGGAVIAGSRGWMCPGSSGFDPETDRKIYDREAIRLGMSLQKAGKGSRIIAMLHYPPFNEKRNSSAFTDLFEEYGVEHVVYGHLHGKSCRSAFEGVREGISYTLCSADHLGFAPKFITEI
ncbi:MAG: metallophosphoesterase [Clostridia bacterium]|nr:metallophosphoesterase [Clostridia bacterium]